MDPSNPFPRSEAGDTRERSSPETGVLLDTQRGVYTTKILLRLSLSEKLLSSQFYFYEHINEENIYGFVLFMSVGSIHLLFFE